MNVEIINFQETKVAVIEHHGSLVNEHESAKKLIAWRNKQPRSKLSRVGSTFALQKRGIRPPEIESKLPPSDLHRSYGIHYNDPGKMAPYPIKR